MLNIVCFKWKKIKKGIQLPSKTEYSSNHVNVLYSMLNRHLTIPFNLICITDNATGIEREIKTLPLWNLHTHLGGCFNRLYVFSKDMKDIIGNRFVCIDLDCVILNNIDGLFDRNDDFIINSYKPINEPIHDQYYNGSMFMMNAGARSKVWEYFDMETFNSIPKDIKKDLVGTDQAWIRYVLGKREKRWTEEDGVYEYRQVRFQMPDNVRIVFFSGKRDPSMARDEWVRRNWK